MKRGATITTVFLATALAAPHLAAMTIDDLQLAQSVDSSGTAATEVIPAGGELVLGDARDLTVTSDGGAVTATAAGGQLVFFAPPGTLGTAEAVWDGADGDPLLLDPIGLGGVDLTDTGAHDAFALTVLSSAGATMVIEVYSDGSNWSAFGFAVPDTTVPTPYVLPYSLFAVGAGTGA